MSRLWLVGLLCVATTQVEANGRLPGTSTINFRQGMETEIAAGMTFGLLWSHDGGATWEYMCEDAVGYGGMYDPRYVYTSTGALVATTFDGMKIDRNECTFDPSPLNPRPPTVKFFALNAQGPDGALYFAAADSTDGQIYKSVDNGQTFPIRAMPGMLNDWWQSLAIAPSDPNRLYLAGYRLKLGEPKVFLNFRSTDGGVSYQPLPVTDFAVMPNSTIDFVGISKTNPELVFARVSLEDNSQADAIYRSTDGGQTWTRILGLNGAISFVVRGNGDLVAGTQLLGTMKSSDNGATWTPVAGAPHINCLVENAAGELWACTQNYGTMVVPSDGFGIMKSSDLATWTGVLKYQDIKAPVVCPAGTKQHDKCDAELWCGVCKQLGCNPGRECPGFDDVDGAPPDGSNIMVNPNSGCCDAGPRPRADLGLFAAAVVIVLTRRRRRASAR